MNLQLSQARSLHAVLLIAIAFPLLTGCHQQGATEEDHLEHIIPAHKPETFPEAVAALEARWQNHEQWSEEARTEFAEIIEWIPELAAQTDLKKQDWDQANSLAKQLAAECDQDELSAETYGPASEELARLAEKAQQFAGTHAGLPTQKGTPNE